MREKWVVRKTIHDHYSDSNQLTYIYMTSCMTMTLDLLPWAIAMGDLGGKYNHKAETWKEFGYRWERRSRDDKSCVLSP